MVRNQQYSDKFFISGQGSNLFANFHVPIVWKSTKGIPLLEGKKIIKAKVKASILLQERGQEHRLTKIEIYEVQQYVAFKELAKYPIEYGNQWMVGVFKSMMGVNTTGLSRLLKVSFNRVPFPEIHNFNLLNVILEQLKTQNILVIFIVVLRVAINVFAFFGVLAIIKRRDCFLWLMMLANFYFICIAGPGINNARFRFPVEVFWFTQAYFGFIWVISCLKKGQNILVNK
jgi:hypothetical protein